MIHEKSQKALVKDKTGIIPDYEYENNDKNEDAVNFSNFDSVWNHGIISDLIQGLLVIL